MATSNPHHKQIVSRIKKAAGKPVKDAFLNSYLGNDHPRYPLTTPELRAIVKEWMKDHKTLSSGEFREVLTSLVSGPTFTEKIVAGMLMDYSAKSQRNFDPAIFDTWLDYLEGWAEVDSLCTGNFPTTQVPVDWPRWKKLIIKLSGDENINKRRASLVLFCSPLGKVYDPAIASEAFRRILILKSEKHVMITKAISWVLRSLTRHYETEVSTFLEEHGSSLPKIAVRETMTKLVTGKKTTRRSQPI